MESNENTYDELPYPGGAFPATHPSHLAMISGLCGVRTAPPSSCRVLELGAALGANLIPMAESLPNSEFVGIDLSARQVAMGNEQIQRLGLKNIELRQLDIAQVDESLGKFDYIICHGVFSWVPAPVRQAILDVGRRLLTPTGVEYVSYNTFPGWHFRSVVREMMKYHVEHLRTAQEKVAQARALLNFLAKSSRSHFKAYETVLKQEAESLEDRGDSYIYHEHLEDVNEPMYFHQFVSQVDSSGLRYLADTSFASMVAQMFDDETAELLKDVPLLRREQYMDFLRSRAFRCSLICHQHIMPDYSMDPKLLLDMHVRVARPGQRSGQPNASGEIEWHFGSAKLSTTDPITGVLDQLHTKYPGWVSVRELVADAPDEARQRNMIECVQLGFVKGLFQLAIEPPAFAEHPSDHPECRRLVQAQAEQSSRVTNWWHNDVMLQPQQRFLARHMNGARSRDDLAQLLLTAVNDGQLRVNSASGVVSDADQAFFRRIVDAEMLMMHSLGLLA